jgi:large subunit ribosomal protein L15
MKLTDLKPSPGAHKKRKRVARGGKLGKTATRGSNGQNSRSGGGKGPTFEGGQTPWYQRLPKYRGFNNIFKEKFQIVKLSDLEKLEDVKEVTIDLLYERNVIKSLQKPVKVLASGKITKALTVKVSMFSQAAREAIEAAGGKAEVI